MTTPSDPRILPPFNPHVGRLAEMAAAVRSGQGLGVVHPGMALLKLRAGYQAPAPTPATGFRESLLRLLGG